MKNFALTGVAGYIAPRHLQAIKDTGNKLIAALDPHDSVGILDRYFPEVRFFTEFERFDRHIEKLRRGPEENRIHYVTICSPNYLHDAQIRFALRVGADAICEKPLVLNPWNIDALEEMEQETGKKVYTILQLRVHPSLIALRKKIMETKKPRYDVCLTYITSRGPWYNFSWKGNAERSGGLPTNIGIHFFDLLHWLFGKVKSSVVHLNTPASVAGFMELESADVRWFLSIDSRNLPTDTASKAQTTYRSITVNGEEIEFSEGFTNLHTEVYKQTLAGNGFGLHDARPSIELVHTIRTAPVLRGSEPAHPKIISA